MRAMQHWAIVATVVVVMAAACGTKAAESKVPVSSGEARVGCLDEVGTIEATAGQWYSDDGGGRLETGNQPVLAYDPDFSPAVEAAMTAAFPDFGVHGGDRGEESTTSGGCSTVRWFDLWDDTGHSYFVSVWRPETRVGLRDHHPYVTAYSALDDRVLVGTGSNGVGQDAIVVLAVAPDGTTAQVLMIAPELPGRERVVRAAQDILDRVLAGRG